MGIRSWARGTGRRGPVAGSVVATVIAVAAAAGCADFSDSEAAPFTGPPTGGATTTTPRQAPQSMPPKDPGPCIDQDALVLATCLTMPTDLITTPEIEHAYVSERGGAIVYTTTDQPNQELVRLNVDTSSDGGLTSIALSPSYVEDRLFYAYISTATDNRIVRVTPGDEPKVILAGIPKGPTGNAGSLMFNGDDLIVATGNAGDPAAAKNAASLAGKVFLVPSPGTVAPARPQILATDGGIRASLCRQPKTGTIFVADQGATQDRLRVIERGAAASVAWSWPDRPGLEGCAATEDGVTVSQSRAGKVQMVLLPQGATTADREPIEVVDRAKYGLFGRLAVGPKGPEGVTINKPNPVSPNDDRIVLLPLPSGEPEGSDD